MSAEVAGEIERLNANQIGASWSLPVAEGAAARVPVVSVRDWLLYVAAALDSEAGRTAVAQHRTSIKMVLKHSPDVASFADLHTGRGITASNATMAARAGCSPGTMRKVRYVLRDVGLAVEMESGRGLSGIEIAAARAHHGGFQTHAASVWHLTSPRATAASQPPSTPRRKSASLPRMTQGVHIAAAAAVAPLRSLDISSGHLSSPTEVGEERYVARKGLVLNSSCVRKKSPTRAHLARTGRINSRKQTRKHWTSADPRPLHLQLSAAELVAECHGIDRGQWVHLGSQQYVRRHGWHIGAVADVLVEAGIDTTRFDGKTIAARLTRYTIERGMNWPNRINAPISFLRSLMAGVDWSQQIPTELAAVRRTRRAQQRDSSTTSISPMPLPRARGAVHGSTGFTEGVNRRHRPVLRSVSEELAAAAGDVCVRCSAPGTVREELPLRTAVCDRCWDSIAAADSSLVLAS
ncbi:hypothetical protein AB0C34_17940 [Nocardia sp. NPDC049220]|uniref:hypothetical protein n=1 Tax=Nocardia sp. NPDC049220 TaxID=3155273 RepID=UPI00340D7AA9